MARDFNVTDVGHKPFWIFSERMGTFVRGLRNYGANVICIEASCSKSVPYIYSYSVNVFQDLTGQLREVFGPRLLWVY